MIAAASNATTFHLHIHIHIHIDRHHDSQSRGAAGDHKPCHHDVDAVVVDYNEHHPQHRHHDVIAGDDDYPARSREPREPRRLRKAPAHGADPDESVAFLPSLDNFLPTRN